MSLILLALFAAEPVRLADAAKLCARPGTERVRDFGQAELKRLDRLPPAETILAVLHRENGCTRPILARDYRQGVGRPR